MNAAFIFCIVLVCSAFFLLALFAPISNHKLVPCCCQQFSNYKDGAGHHTAIKMKPFAKEKQSFLLLFPVTIVTHAVTV